MDTDNQPALAGADAIDIVQSAEQSTNEAETVQENAEQVKSDSADLPIPKKILNAMSHKDRRIGKLTAKQYEAEAKIRQLEEQLAKHSPKDNQPSAPEAAKFDNYEDYLKSLAEFKVNERFSESEKKRLTQEQQVSHQTRHAERIAHLEQNDEAAREVFSDFENVFKENEHIVMEAPEHIKQAFLEAENPAYAFYALAKEGKLEDMLTMSPYQAVAMIARYEDKAIALSKEKQVTKAPAPLSPSKGTAAGSKSLDSFSPDELLKWVNSK